MIGGSGPTSTWTDAPEVPQHRHNGAHPIHPNASTPIRAHCGGGWRSEPVINNEFAHQKWERHLAEVQDAAP